MSGAQEGLLRSEPDPPLVKTLSLWLMAGKPGQVASLS